MVVDRNISSTITRTTTVAQRYELCKTMIAAQNWAAIIELKINWLYCGDKEIRTLDPLLAKQVLYQLSYTPKAVVPGRVELPTSTLSVWRSNQLS